MVQSKKRAIFDVNVALANLEFNVHVTSESMTIIIIIINVMVSLRREIICSRT